MKGIGIDLCEISRMERMMTESFLARYYTQEEREYIASRGKTGAQSAAAMFAAKEAFLKACRAGIGTGIALDEIGVEHLPGGAPQYRLTGAALEKMQTLGASGAWLSLTHEGGMAAAVCVIE